MTRVKSSMDKRREKSLVQIRKVDESPLLLVVNEPAQDVWDSQAASTRKFSEEGR